MAPTIVVQRRPRVRTPLLVAVTSVFVLAIPVLYGISQNASLGEAGRLARDIDQAHAQAARMARQVRDLENANERLRQELIDLKKGRDIDRAAFAEVQKSLGAEQQQAASLREQLAFYRGVMSPQALLSGLHVNELRVSTGPSGVFHYDLVLVQAARQDRHASGRVELRVIGRDRRVQRSLSLPELGIGGALRFSFRHFQELSGEMKLPTGFKPERVVVTLLPDSGDTPHVEQDFEWSRVAGPSP
jgi:hypothetical protein